MFNDAASIRPDDAFWPAIQQGIADSELFVCVISAASSASDRVRREVEHTRSLGRRVIGLRIDDAPLPPHFAAVDVVNFRVGRAAEKRLDLSRILRYAPEDLIGREAEKHLISAAWARTLRAEAGRPHLLCLRRAGWRGQDVAGRQK